MNGFLLGGENFGFFLDRTHTIQFEAINDVSRKIRYCNSVQTLKKNEGLGVYTVRIFPRSTQTNTYEACEPLLNVKSVAMVDLFNAKGPFTHSNENAVIEASLNFSWS